MCKFCFCIIFVSCLGTVEVLENGLARIPPMGWMSWGYYECAVECEENSDKCLNEKLIMSVADTFYDDGYIEAGYEYIIIDDCWSEHARDKDGRLVPDKKRFPRGMKFLADYIHSKGLKFGMYTNVGKFTCKGYPGSRHYYDIDAKMFAEWGVDYLKVDGCFVGKNVLNTDYKKLGTELLNTKRPIVYSCSWPFYIQFIIREKPNFDLISKHCNLWRVYVDVAQNWQSVLNILQYFEDHYEVLAPHHGPGHWNDPDMLVVGTGVLTPSQSRIQMAIFAMLSAPLLLSCDLNMIDEHDKQLLQNLDLIAIAQDPLGIMAKPYKLAPNFTLWVKQHLPKKGDICPTFSFAIVNTSIRELDVTLAPYTYGLNCTDGYSVLDIFSGTFIRNITSSTDKLHVTVPSEDVFLYTMFAL